MGWEGMTQVPVVIAPLRASLHLISSGHPQRTADLTDQDVELGFDNIERPTTSLQPSGG